MKSTAYYVKTAILMVLLFLEAFYLTTIITQFVAAQNYFGISLNFSLKIVGAMLALVYTFSLSIGAWKTWEQYVIITVPVLMAVSISLARYSLNYAIIVTILFGLILVLDIRKSTKISNLMTKFNPKLVLRLSARGILLIFSVLGGLLVILHSAHIEQEFNIGQKIAEMTKDPIKSVVNRQLEEQLQEQSPYLQTIESLGLGDALDQQSQSGLPLGIDMDVGNIVEEQINTFIEPYKSFVQPLMAILVFALFHFYTTITLMVFTLTVDILFKVAKYTKFINVEQVEVIQEKLHF
ncbi:hypothetical protein OAL67_00700 [bacterium]|nr:hypothetical protein [bacterium]